MPNTTLRYHPDAIATHLGWAHSITGEQLVSARNLEADTGTETYDPNNRNWMRSYQEGGDSPTPNSFVSLTYTAVGLAVTVTGKVKYPRAADTVAIAWGDAATSTATPNLNGVFTATHTYATAGTKAATAEIGAYTPDVVGALSIVVAA